MDITDKKERKENDSNGKRRTEMNLKQRKGKNNKGKERMEKKREGKKREKKKKIKGKAR